MMPNNIDKDGQGLYVDQHQDKSHNKEHRITKNEKIENEKD